MTVSDGVAQWESAGSQPAGSTGRHEINFERFVDRSEFLIDRSKEIQTRVIGATGGKNLANARDQDVSYYLINGETSGNLEK